MPADIACADFQAVIVFGAVRLHPIADIFSYIGSAMGKRKKCGFGTGNRSVRLKEFPGNQPLQALSERAVEGLITVKTI